MRTGWVCAAAGVAFLMIVWANGPARAGEQPAAGAEAAASMSPAEVAAAAAKLDGAKLYRERTCIACHGPDAKTPILPAYPKLAGQNPDYMFRQIRDIKSGARANGQTAAMRGVLFLVNEVEMKAITNYIATLDHCSNP